MALQSPKVYHLLQKMFTLYEEGKLKGQKVHMMKGDALHKAIQWKFSARLHHFKVFQGLKVRFNKYKVYYSWIYMYVGCWQDWYT